MLARFLMIRFALIAGMLIAGAGNAAAQITYCFQSIDGNKLNLRFTLIDKDWKYGYIQYNKPEYGIFIRQKYSHPIDSYNSPGLTEYMWEEVRNDSVTGTYQFMKQAESISDIIYTRAKDKKQFKFGTGTAFKDCECDW